MELGKRIARRIKELGITQRQLAERSGLTQPAISKYISNQIKPSYEAVMMLSRPNWFFIEEGNLQSPDDSFPQWEPRRPVARPTSAGAIAFPTSGKIARGATFVIGHWLPMQEFPSPTQARSHGIITNFYSLIFNQLAHLLPDGKLRGALAIDWTSVGNSWVFQLREGARFHDGKPLVAEDVVWSYERYLQQNPQDPRIDGVQVLDARFVQIHLKSPCRIQEVPMPFILPYGTKEPLTEWIGTGPFQPIQLSPSFWRLRKNPYYFFSEPFFGEVHIRQYADAEALEKALVSGEVHLAIQLYSPAEGFTARTEPAALRYHLHFMVQEALVQNSVVRQAIALALDREALAKVAGLKEALYSTGPFDQILNDRSHTPPLPYPEAAVQLLKQTPSLQDSTRRIQDSLFRVKYNQTAPESRPIAEAIVEQLNRIGISAEVGDPPHAQVVIRLINPFEPEYALWETANRYNINGYSNPAVDQLIQQLRNTVATSQQLLELRRLIQRDLPDIPLFYGETPITYSNRLHALEGRVVLLNCLSDIHTWYLSQEVKVEAQTVEICK